MDKSRGTQIEGMFLITGQENIKGLNHWADELERRGIPAIILVKEETVDNNCDVIKNISDRGFEIGGSFLQPFWDESYEYQYEKISRINDKVQSCTHKAMRIFNSKYFAYDETTSRVADKLGIEYVLARGAAGAKAAIYQPHEYRTKILFVSNVPSKEMGTGSLCDQSLFSRGETPRNFRNILFDLTVDKIILVAHMHLSGVKLHWWNVYQDFLNANIVTWKSLDEFVTNPVALPIALIPLNREVKYVIPKPKIPLKEEPEYPFANGAFQK